jgi:predicted nucleotidyltransferase/protein-tyrosine phosphatase
LSEETRNDWKSSRSGLPGWSELDRVLEELQSWGHRQEKVIGVFVYGSIARGESDRYSDLDLVVIVRSGDQAAEVERSLLDSWECLFDFVKDRKHVCFLKRPFIKVELSVVPEDRLSELHTMFTAPPAIEVERAVLVDKSGTLGNILSKWSSEANGRSEDDFEREANSFLYYYNGFYAPFTRGDTYRAFFQYCLMFFKIATLSYIAKGGKNYLYTPRQLMYTLDKEDAYRLRSFSPTFDPMRMKKDVEQMFDFFLELVNRSGMTRQFPPTTMRNLRAEILAHHPRFLGLRDLGMIEGVRPAIVFRSSRLDRYPPEELIDWINATHLRTIIDLRTIQEIQDKGSGYSSQILERVAYLHLPTTDKLSDEHIAAAPSGLSPMELLYAKLPLEKSFQEALRQIVKVLADPTRCPAVLHCRGGKDRTGMLVAIILQAAGISEKEILADYLLSFRDTRPVYLQRLLESLPGGGAEAYLKAIGISHADLLSLRRNIMISGKGA